MIERIHLSILREVERKGSLTSAAKALCLTQSALSHAIKKLEYQLGLSLWEKHGRNIRLTQAGNHLLFVANRLLPQLERTEQVLAQFASGDKGELLIGMECHPCYQWMLQVVEVFLKQWPGVDIDVKQKFQFGGMAALFSHDIDILVTPDPLFKKGVTFVPVFDYEQVLVVSTYCDLASKVYIEPEDLIEYTLFSYPVETERLDIFAQFLVPAQCQPKHHKKMESTDIMLQMVAANRGVAAMPRWLIDEYAQHLSIKPVQLGEQGIAKKIYVGIRDGELSNRHTQAFLAIAKGENTLAD
ncbi:LysR family transcriptional regulator [Aliikangiella sp. IMCC44359]|uniref:LysR family transcriptional regulator n=1 Tax=Aliikangiella sp. IMCC44359 TaxID=3459125 RepID=UPI00403AA085